DESRVGADGTKEEGSPLHKLLVTPMGLVLSVCAGLLTTWVLDLQLIESVAAALGALVGSGLAFLLFHRLSAMLALSFGAVMVAGVIAVGVTAAVLSFSGIAPFQTFARMVEFGTRPDSLVRSEERRVGRECGAGWSGATR